MTTSSWGAERPELVAVLGGDQDGDDLAVLDEPGQGEGHPPLTAIGLDPDLLERLRRIAGLGPLDRGAEAGDEIAELQIPEAPAAGLLTRKAEERRGVIVPGENDVGGVEGEHRSGKRRDQRVEVCRHRRCHGACSMSLGHARTGCEMSVPASRHAVKPGPGPLV